MLRISVLLLLAATIACGDAGRSPAADVPNTDIRRLPPQRKESTPDMLLNAADRGRTLGQDSARVWVVVVSDFQCPFCKMWHDQTLPAIRAHYVESGKVRIAFVNYPLRIHRHAVAAANAAACASGQGRFWEAHDRIFAAQDAWTDADSAVAMLDSLATVPGVDGRKLKECTHDGRLLRLIRADIDRSEAGGTRSVPTVIIGTHRITGAAPTARYRAAIDSALAGR